MRYHRTKWQLFRWLVVLGSVAFASACQDSENSATKAENAASEAASTAPAATQPTAALEPVANTRYGPVRGFVEGGMLTFKGIRYGADTSTTRFAAPAAPQAWIDPVNAVAFGDSAPQPPGEGPIGLLDSWAPDPQPGNSEDCLFLNVWTPALADQGKRPVLVWFHGGGFTAGSGSSNAYNGARLANRGDVVVVTVNHRLNVFGYLHLDEYGPAFAGSANAGMLDLVASLEWVRDNIAEFGGDPDNVLIFGESGGGWKVSALMAMDSAQGLFHRAVVQSGPGLELMPAEQATTEARALVAELGLDESSVDQIRSMPAEKIMAAAVKLAQNGGPLVGTVPVIDGIHQLRHPFTPDAPKQSRDVPLLIGSTQTEMSLLSGAFRPELLDLTWETLPAALTASIEGVDATAVIDGYRALQPDIDAPTLYFEATTDNSIFGRGSFVLADRKAAQGGAPVYQYYLAWKSPVDDGKWGAPHAMDIGFVFDNVAMSESMAGVGEKQQALADVMSEAWLAFARNGNPNHSGLPEWAPYDADRRATMVFDDEPKLVDDPRGRQMDLLDGAD